MNERRMQFRVGVVVFATMIIGAVLMTVNDPLPSGWLPWLQSTYRVGIKVPSAPGVGPNTPVHKNGILIGRVDSIEDDNDGVIVHADVDADRPLTNNQVPHVRTSMLGDATIDFVTVRGPAPPQPLDDGAIVIGEVDVNPLESLGKLGDLQEEFAGAARSLSDAGDQVSKLAETVNNAFGDETERGRVTRLLDTTEVAMSHFAQTMSAMNEIIGDAPAGTHTSFSQPLPDVRPAPDGGQPIDQPPVTLPPAGQPPTEGQQMRQRMRQGLNEMPDAIREARITMQQFRGTLELANTNLRNLEGFTEPLGQRGEEIAASLIEAIQGLDQLVDDFSSLTQALNNREGTIGRLIHDAQVYENLNRLMCNANTVLGQVNDLTLRLRPILDDVRVFTDKVAREPGRVVTGGLNPSLTK